MSRTMKHKDKRDYWRKTSGTSKRARRRRLAAAVGEQTAFEADRRTRRLEDRRRLTMPPTDGGR